MLDYYYFIFYDFGKTIFHILVMGTYLKFYNMFQIIYWNYLTFHYSIDALNITLNCRIVPTKAKVKMTYFYLFSTSLNV